MASNTCKSSQEREQPEITEIKTEYSPTPGRYSLPSSDNRKHAAFECMNQGEIAQYNILYISFEIISTVVCPLKTPKLHIEWSG